ncbi:MULTISPECIES: GlxA family transcriptional regulator [Photorhabdus]|uniref:Transcriptional regulator, arac family with amidase-like domain n=2 Tax=Photorhabdus asymbiotica TaxID=291112 RepID=C7BK57_PHOAA|nr:GlxA family transcriptional regulator [Photorhabdus asymbiotica]RKS65818.1 transcriptional regulator GlxA family with amidase domain [Photorhabdus asymbiotica]CAQ84297.1 transcriptional regulator, arac family with amidase-like domain [Photorhabdus asymbiotica]
MIVAFYVFPDFQLLDLSGPLAAFQAAGLGMTPCPYQLYVLSAQGGEVRSSSGIAITTQSPDAVKPDTLLIVGGRGVRHIRRDSPETERLRNLCLSASRFGSICTGVFALAETGLLKGKKATTHWKAVERFKKAWPDVLMDGEPLFVRDGNIWTSAGITSGIDLALAMIEVDLGREVSRQVAQELVVYQRRPGGQSQFSPMLQLEPTSSRISSVLSYIQAHLSEDLDVIRLAEVACLSVRQFSRQFKNETGKTPARAVELLRIDAARASLESGADSIEQIARRTGFGHPERMRRAFLRYLGRPPQTYRMHHRE